LLAQLHAPDLAYHFHGDHLLALLLKYSAEQLNTLVNFESALLGLDGQFSVGVNSKHGQWRVPVLLYPLSVLPKCRLPTCSDIDTRDCGYGDTAQVRRPVAVWTAVEQREGL
jgi:hypothetical protein